MMDRQRVEAVVAEWMQAWGRCDAAALSRAHAEDGVYDSMLAGQVRGREAIESLYRSWFSAFPDMAFEVEQRLIDGDRVALVWSQRGSHSGDFCGLSGTGRTFRLDGVFVLEFRDGSIARMRSIYDFTGLLLQLGVLKAKPA